MDQGKVLALDNNKASLGELAHTVRAAQILIDHISDVTTKTQITGRLRHLDYSGHEVVELLAIPIFSTNFVGDPNSTTALHVRLHELIHNWICPDPPNYHWIGPFYRYTLTTVRTESQLTLAQIVHTGPEDFAKWVTSEEAHKHGALPWGFSVSDYQLFNYSKEPVETPDEHEFFKSIGFNYISMDDRDEGNPSYWNKFKQQPVV